MFSFVIPWLLWLKPKTVVSQAKRDERKAKGLNNSQTRQQNSEKWKLLIFANVVFKRSLHKKGFVQNAMCWHLWLSELPVNQVNMIFIADSCATLNPTIYLTKMFAMSYLIVFVSCYTILLQLYYVF